MVNATECLQKSNSEPSSLRARAERVFQQEIAFIPSNEFDKLLAAKTTLTKFEAVAPRRTSTRRLPEAQKALTCLAPALMEPLFSFSEEQHEFRRMNYLKFVAARLRSTLCKHRPARRKLDEIEKCLADANEVRNHIVRSNLRLVLANAGKYCSSTYGFEDLVSDGSLALMEAVDKFDYQRGFRFSTYATHAIRRSFFRKIERRQKEQRRFIATDPGLMSATADRFEVDLDAPAENRLIQQVVGSLGEHLTERELHIVEGRFGLNGRSEPRTLLELSGELGICKERVRQVEGLALRKLHAIAETYATAGSDRTETTSS